MNWRLKGVVQKVLGAVPGGQSLHYLLQRRGGGLADFAGECDSKVDDWGLMIGHLHKAGLRVEGATLMEMGTGWYPAFPLCLYLSGAARVITVDLNRHLKDDMVRALADRLGLHVDRIALRTGRTPGEVGARREAVAAALHRGASLAEATAGVVDYHAPADARATGLPDCSVDVVFSNSVLEHVPDDVIRSCFTEAWRILRPGGVVFHSVNCGDHYAYVDPSINQLHYLQYSDSAWSLWNNRFLYQNRLRAVDFTTMARGAGFTIEIDTSAARPERLTELARIEVHPRFARYTREELSMTTIDFVGRKAAG